MTLSIRDARDRLALHDQDHVLRFWNDLSPEQQEALLQDIAEIDFHLMTRLVEELIIDPPPPETFERIDSVETLPPTGHNDSAAREAWDAGEAALREGRVGLVVVAGGQGTRLGYDGPKGAFPIGPVTGKSLFQYHAEKIRYLQDRYGCAMPWYVMVSEANDADTRAFFEENGYFGLHPDDVMFFTQNMIPCVDESGHFLLDQPHRLARNPNGHGGCIPALVERGVTRHADDRGVDMLCYFQVDNWAVKVADPYFIGYHLLRGGQMASKAHRKKEVRDTVGVHCLCEGEHRIIEYSELDRYPQLLETNADGKPVHFAGNPAIHILSIPFVEEVYREYEKFPWHRAHKKIPYVNERGKRVTPDEPNGYKFETFIFDALRLVDHGPVVLEIHNEGEYTPIKQFEGPNSVTEARRLRNRWWAEWLEAAGVEIPRTPGGDVLHDIEISPQFAQNAKELAEKAHDLPQKLTGPLVIETDGSVILHEPAEQT